MAVFETRKDDTVRCSFQPPLLVYNRSEDGIDGFKTYAKSKDLDDGAYKIVEDLLEIGKTWVSSHLWWDRGEDAVANASADLVLTSLGSDEAVTSVYNQLFKGQEVGREAFAKKHG